MSDKFDQKEMLRNVLVIIGVCTAHAVLPLLFIFAVGYSICMVVT